MESQIMGVPISKLVDEALKPKAAEVWKTLSEINVNDHIEKKNGYSYLTWSWAWATLMEHYPASTFYFENQEQGEIDANNEGVIRFPDETAEVRCTVTVEGITRSMWLPVMDYKNNAIKNPNARDINDAKMRCLVKALSLFGLGLYIYAGEDLPEKTKKVEAPAKPADAPPAVDQVKELKDAISAATNLDELKAAFTKATRYSKNRNDDALTAEFTALKDELKKKLSA